jgi:hypothetical protein
MRVPGGLFKQSVELRLVTDQPAFAATHQENNEGCWRPVGSCASTAAIAVMFRMPRAVTDGVKIWAGRDVPMRIGPTGNASANALII